MGDEIYDADPYEIMFKIVADLDPEEPEDPEIREYIMRLDPEDPLRDNYFAIYNQLDPAFIDEFNNNNLVADDNIPDDNIPDIIYYNNLNNKQPKTNKRLFFSEPSNKLLKNNNDKYSPDAIGISTNKSVIRRKRKPTKTQKVDRMKSRKSRSKSNVKNKTPRRSYSNMNKKYLSQKRRIIA
jgi:hypothetical protein